MFRLENYPKLLWEPTEDQHVAINTLPSKKGFILADVTGKGKTYSALASFGVLQKYNPEMHLLVLSTKSSVAPWRQGIAEATKFTKEEFLVNTPEKDEITEVSWDITVMAYTAIRKYPNFLKTLLENRRVVLAADEFHKADSPKTQIGSVVRYLRDHVAYFWGLTATPLGNKIECLYNLVDCVRPGFLGYNFYAFMRKHCLVRWVKVKRRGKRGRKEVPEVIGIKCPSVLAQLLRQVMLRRDLDIPVKFNRVISKPLRSEMRDYLVAAAGELGIKGEKAKQFSARLPDLQLVVNNATTRDKEFNGDISSVNSKERAFLRLARDLLNASEPLAVFTSSLWTQDRLLLLLKALQVKMGISRVLHINGKSSSDARFEVSETFGDTDILVMSPAGGESLNLQASGHLVLYDLPYDLRQFIQAAGRVVRMNTCHPEVNIHIMEALGTIDSYKSLMIFSNAQLFEEVLKGTSTLPTIKGRVTKEILAKMRRKLLWMFKEMRIRV